MIFILEFFAVVIGLLTFLFWLTVTTIIVLIIVRIFMLDKYSEESVIQRWNALLPGQESYASGFLDKVESTIKEQGFNYISDRREKIPISLITPYGVVVPDHNFLVIQFDKNYTCYVSAIAKGKDLAISWLIQDHMIKGIYKLKFIGPLLTSVFKRYTFAMTNDVIAFSLATHAAVMAVTEEIMDEKLLDKSRLPKRSSGKLGRL